MITIDKNCSVEKSIILFALRYALGRQTFAPTIAIDNFKYNIDKFKIPELHMVISEIRSHGNLHSYGADCDRETWMNFIAYLYGESDKKLDNDKEV